jgi:hypothetical protein
LRIVAQVYFALRVHHFERCCIAFRAWGALTAHMGIGREEKIVRAYAAWH